MEQMPHHREGIQKDLDKAYDEGHRDNKAFDEAQVKSEGETRLSEEEKAYSPELAVVLTRLRDAGYLDTSFEGKETHSLAMRALSKEEALAEYKTSGDKTWVSGELEKNRPYTVPSTESFDVMMMNFSGGIESDEALAEMDTLGVRPLTYEELIQYGIAHPSHQTQGHPLIALGSTHTISGLPYATFLSANANGRTLNDYNLGSAYMADLSNRFLVVHK